MIQSQAAIRRIMVDYKHLKSAPFSGVFAVPVDQKDMSNWIGVVEGPADSAWEGGLYFVKITFPLTGTKVYPFAAPKIEFINNPYIYHPNVGSYICLTMLSSEGWNCLYNMEGFLVALRSLLTDPNPSSPLNSEAANMYKNDREKYDQKVKKLAADSADPKNFPKNNAIDRLMDLYRKKRDEVIATASN